MGGFNCRLVEFMFFFFFFFAFIRFGEKFQKRYLLFKIESQTCHLFFCSLVNSAVFNVQVSTYSVPSGFRANLQSRPEGPSLMGRVGRVRRVGRSRKVFFKFLHTLWVYRLCMYLLLYEIKIVTNILMGFKF